MGQRGRLALVAFPLGPVGRHSDGSRARDAPALAFAAAWVKECRPDGRPVFVFAPTVPGA